MLKSIPQSEIIILNASLFYIEKFSISHKKKNDMQKLKHKALYNSTTESRESLRYQNIKYNLHK